MWFDFFPFYSTLLIGNTKKAKELGQNISFWCHYYNSRGLYVQFCLLLFGKGFFYCQKSFSLEGFQKTEKAAPHHSVIKLPNFRCISKQKWHRKLKKGSQKNPVVHCILFFSPRSINAVSPACLSSFSHFRIVSNVKLWKWKWKSEMLLLISKPINTVVALLVPLPKKSQKRISTSSSLYYYVNSILGVEQQRLLQPWR